MVSRDNKIPLNAYAEFIKNMVKQREVEMKGAMINHESAHFFTWILLSAVTDVIKGHGYIYNHYTKAHLCHELTS